MIEGGLTSAETTLGGFELAGGELAGFELVVGAAIGVMGGVCTSGITTGDGDAGFG